MTGRRSPISFPDSSERQKRRGDADEEDRISNLPQSILSRILSLMPTKNAVSTAILSKRWKFLWTTAFNLDFCCPEDYTGSVEHFIHFVNYVLLLHKPGCLNRLSLTWKKGCIPLHVNTWISAALARDVHELFVSADISKLPIHVFTSEMLQSLELDRSIYISSEISVSLPRLERLTLTSVYFQSKKALSNLLEGCPMLKYLDLMIDVGKMVEHGHINTVDGIAVNADGSEFKCMISSAFLTHLELFLYGIHPSKPQVVCYVELDAPSLHCIRLGGCINSIFIQQKSLALLDEADIQISVPTSREPNYFDSLDDAVSAFGCAKNLTLRHQVIQALSCATTMKISTRFDRLTTLEVWIDLNNWSALQDFIMLSDNLQVLKVNKFRRYERDPRFRSYARYEVYNNISWKKLDIVPRCLSKSLRRVRIDAYDGFRDELAMVDYIMKHGRVLQTMQICFGDTTSDLKRKYQLLAKICAFPRNSKICEVKIVDSDYESDDDAF